jgi:hypothetical protein
VCALGLVVGDDSWGPAGDEDQAASGDRGDGHGWRPRPRVMAGGGAGGGRGGDGGGVDGPVGVEGPVSVGEGEPVKVRAEQPVVDLAGPLGHRR